MPETRFPENELEDSLRRAFVDGHADFIIVDGHTLRNNFLRESIQLGLDQGLLYQGKTLDEDDTLGRGLGQWSALTYRLTDEGKKYFGLQ